MIILTAEFPIHFSSSSALSLFAITLSRAASTNLEHFKIQLCSASSLPDCHLLMMIQFEVDVLEIEILKSEQQLDCTSRAMWNPNSVQLLALQDI